MTTPDPTVISPSAKLDVLLWLMMQQQQTLNAVWQMTGKIMSEQADFNTDITALTADLAAVLPFLAALPAQLTAIQTALANEGVTDLSALDNLVSEASNVAPNVSSLQSTLGTMPGGTVTAPTS